VPAGDIVLHVTHESAGALDVSRHIVRGRDECCAGIYTTIGLVTGISVMLLSLGPGVYFLYIDRMARIRQPAPEAGPS